MEKLNTRKEAAEILGISIYSAGRGVTMVLFLMCAMCRMAVCILTSAGFRSISQKCTTERKPAEKNAVLS